MLAEAILPQLVPGTRWLERRGDHAGSVATIVKTTAQKVYITLVAHLQNSHSRRKAKGRTHAIDLSRFYASYEPYDSRSQRLAYETAAEPQSRQYNHQPNQRKESIAEPMTITLESPPTVEPAVPSEPVAEATVTEAMRHCIHCEQDKPVSEFHPSGPGITRHTCRDCENLRRRQSYAHAHGQAVPVAAPPVAIPPATAPKIRGAHVFSDTETDEVIGFWRAHMPVDEIARAFKTNPSSIYHLLRERIPVEYDAQRIAVYITKHGGQPIVGYVFMQQLSLTSSQINTALASPTGRELLHDFMVTKPDKPWIKTRWIGLIDQHDESLSTNGEVHTDSEETPVISRSAAIEDRIMAQGTTRGTTLTRTSPGYTKRPDLSPTIRAEIVRRYQAGHNTRALTGEYNIAPGTLYRILEQAGVSTDRSTSGHHASPVHTVTQVEQDDLWATTAAPDTAPIAFADAWDTMANAGVVVDPEPVATERVTSPAVTFTPMPNGQQWAIRARVVSEVTFTVTAESMTEAMAVAGTYDLFSGVAQPTGTPQVKLIGITLKEDN